MSTYHRDNDGGCATFDILDPDGDRLGRVTFWDGEDTGESSPAEAKVRPVVHRLIVYGELVRALHYLLEQTVDMSLRNSVGMPPGEEQARPPWRGR